MRPAGGAAGGGCGQRRGGEQHGGGDGGEREGAHGYLSSTSTALAVTLRTLQA